MAKSARQTVFEGMELLPEALAPFVEKRLDANVKGHWQADVLESLRDLRADSNGQINWDQASLLRTMMKFWSEAFSSVLGKYDRSFISEILEVRNRLSHNERFNYDDAERALDTIRRLMISIGASDVADQLSKMRDTILRTKFAELTRTEERRKSSRADISVDTVAGLLPWRDVVEPHQDVATGDFQQAEFAADLAKVHSGSAPSEYRDPEEFFARTYLTDGLSTLLVGAAKRLSGQGGDPVVELQTNFGGGKTHSMLALYHMAGKSSVQDLPGLDQLLSDANLSVPDTVSRAVLVGTSRGPADVIERDKQEIRTTWGDMAWQLGGASAFALIAENDASGIAPGSDLLEKLFKQCAPSLILIDEWVAYLRQIYRIEGLPAGTFDANISFVQSLTEAVKASPQTLLVASLPASQIEVGGEGGQEALVRLKQTFSRVESSWRPASQEESYEIVRRRLFKDIPGDKFQHRDNTLKQFGKLYRDNAGDFPPGCADEDYRRKLDKAYPIHPELFDQLYTSWGSLEKFQRTRGVLRLMAQVIHELWMSGDPSVVIMPGSVGISSPRVEPELLHYLKVNWQSIIASDVDGVSATPYKIDQSAPNLNRYSATRRIARAIFVGTAPTEGQENQGLDDKQINLGVVQPGERPAIFGDALRRLTNQAKFMHSDHGRYWYSESPSLNRMAADRAAQLEEALITLEIDKALSKYINSMGDRGHFDAVQVAPQSSSDVPDEANGVRLVVLGVAYPHTGRDGSAASIEAKDILTQRGNAPRVYRNTLIFAAAEARQLDSLSEAVRSQLAWEQIAKDAEGGRLDLMRSDTELAKSKARDAAETCSTRLRESWCCLLYPHQDSPQSDIEWSSARVPAQDGLLSRASKKLVSDEALLAELGPARLDRDLQKYLWREFPHLSLKELWDFTNRYVYLPRLKSRETLVKTVQTAIGNVVPGVFAYAESHDEEAKEYKGLAVQHPNAAQVVIDSESLILRPEIVEAQLEKVQAELGSAETAGLGASNAAGREENKVDEKPPVPDPTRFLGSVMISAERPAKEMHQIVEAIVEQLTTLPGSEVSLRLEIDAEVPTGLDRAKVRTLLENANTLGFIDKAVS